VSGEGVLLKRVTLEIVCSTDNQLHDGGCAGAAGSDVQRPSRCASGRDRDAVGWDEQGNISDHDSYHR
jgi:hypothetical protein